MADHNREDQAVLYSKELYAREDEALAATLKTIAASGRTGVNVGPIEGRFLQLLIGLTGARKVIEVGTLHGYSATWISRALGKEGHLITIEKDPDYARQAIINLKNAGADHNTEVRVGPAESILPQLNGLGPFDMIFLDANKSGYNDVLDWALINLKDGALIVADNTLLKGAVTHADWHDVERSFQNKPGVPTQTAWREIRRFNERMSQKPFDSLLLPFADGWTISILRK